MVCKVLPSPYIKNNKNRHLYQFDAISGCKTNLCPYHFISKNSIYAILIESYQPVQTGKLVISHVPLNTCKMNVQKYLIILHESKIDTVQQFLDQTIILLLAMICSKTHLVEQKPSMSRTMKLYTLPNCTINWNYQSQSNDVNLNNEMAVLECRETKLSYKMVVPLASCFRHQIGHLLPLSDIPDPLLLQLTLMHGDPCKIIQQSTNEKLMLNLKIQTLLDRQDQLV